HSAGRNQMARASVIRASHGRATKLTASSASDGRRTSAKKNALEMIPVAITSAKHPGSSVAICAGSHRTRSQERATALLRDLSGVGSFGGALMGARPGPRSGGGVLLSKAFCDRMTAGTRFFL